MRNFALLSLLLLLVVGSTFGATRYNAVAEWNGPYFHIINNPSQDQKVDNPVTDIPFSSPIAVAGRIGGYDSQPQIYVADQDNDRIQLFTTPVMYKVLDATTSWNYTGADPAAALDVNDDCIALDLWDDDDLAYRVVKGSVILKVDGELWTEVSSLTGYTASDEVFYVNYHAAMATPDTLIEIKTPSNSFSDDDGDSSPDESIEVYYAYALNDKLADPAADSGDELTYGQADIDYGLVSSGDAFVKVQIDETTTDGIDDIQSLRSLAAMANLTTSTTTELYILDMDDNSSNGDEYLFMYTIDQDGVIDATPNEASTIEKYDGVLSYPEDIFVADVTGHTAEDAAFEDPTGITDLAGSATVTDASQVTDHEYTLSYTHATTSLSITDATTGETLVSDTIIAADMTLDIIPGIRFTVANPLAAAGDESDTYAATDADYGRYIFVADTDNDRIKVIEMADVTDGDFVGDWLNGDDRDAGTEVDEDTELQKTTPANASDARNWSFYTACAPIKEGSLDTIKIGDHTWHIDPDNNLENNDGNDSLYTVDYMTGHVDFGDGTNGARVELSQAVTYTYTTSVDVMRYGSVGTGAGQFNQPKGITARWNTELDHFDVYVSDAGNNRIQKFAFDPGDDVTPPSMNYVTQWNTASSATDLLGHTGDIFVAQETGTLDTVWVYVADVSNNRVVTYIDGGAISGSNAAPSFDRIIGTHGNQLGSFMEPAGMWALPNNDNFDLFIADEDRNMVQIFQEADPVSITLSETGVSRLPKEYSPGGTYTIGYDIAGAFECGYVNFYYSTDTIFDAGDKLCNEENTITATAETGATWDWKFADSPDGMPEDGTYYLFGKVVTCDDNEELANDKTTNALTIDSDLLVKLSLRDFFDEDGYMLLQNGAEKGIDLTLDYPVGVTSIEVNGSYPSDMFRIVSINKGNIFDVEGEATNVIFQADWDSSAGTWTIDMSQTGDPDGCNVSPGGDVAIINIKAREDLITPEAALVVDTFAIDTDSSQVITYEGTADSDLGFNQMVVYGAYLGDIATPGANHGTPPNMTPIPNGAIGFEDLMVWTRGWDGDTVGNHDAISDLGPTIGTVPDKIAEPDGYLEVEDILALNTMYSWWTTNNVPKMITDVIPNAKRLSVETSEEGKYVRARAVVEDVYDLMGAHLLLSYNKSELELVRVVDGGFLSAGDAQALTLTRDFAGGIEICMSRMSRTEPTVDGSGIVVEVVFEKKAKTADIFFDYELANYDIQMIENGTGKAVPQGEGTLPEAISLLQNTPNPFNSATNVSFVVDEAARVKLTVHDILGNQIETILDRECEAGKHNVKWNGTDRYGTPVATGEYLLRMDVDGEIQTRRMLYVK
ncbi:MAG: FlgD immunoglobulin-like domain containing protein [Candidatus Zixiibacteriota bacterium]